MRSQCTRPVCIGLFLTIVVSVCTAQQSPRSEVAAFALQLVNSSSQQRTELLAAHQQLITVALRKELLRHGNNFLVDSKYAPALEVYRLAEKVADQISDKEGLAEISLNIGSVYYFQGQHERALEYYRKAQQLFASIGNRSEVARSLLGLAMTLQAQGNLHEALATFEKALKEFEALDDRQEMANALANIGSLQYDLGNYDAASKTLLRLSTLRTDGRTLLQSAAAFYMQRDYTQALTYYEQALDLATKNANAAEAISALTGAANCYYNQRDYDLALDFYNRSLEISERLNDKSGVATQLQSIGNVHRARGDYGSALQSYFKSLEAAAAAPTKGSVANTLGSIGVVRSLQGNNLQAIEYFDKSLRAFEANGDQVGMARLFSYMGNARFIQGQFDLALAAYQRGLELHRSLADSLNQAHLKIAIGTVYVTQKNYAFALASYQQGLAMYETLRRRAETAEALIKIAAAYRLQGEHAKGLERANRALSLVQVDDLPAIRSLALTEIGRLQRGLDHSNEALTAFNEAIRIQQLVRADPGSQDSETQASYVLPYLGAMEVLIDQGKANDALARSEDAKSELLRQIINRGNFTVTKEMTAAEQKEEMKLLGGLRSLALQLSSVQESRPNDAPRIKALTDRVTAARAAYESFRQRLYARYPHLPVYRGTLAPFNLEQARPLLLRDTAILEYAVTEEGVYLFVVTTGAVNAYALAIKPAEITELASRFLQLLATKDPSSMQVARDLYDVLLKPAEQQITTKSKLIIIPDDVLWDVPFAALQPLPDQYVIDQKTLSYAISVSALREMRRRRSVRRATATVLAFADPVRSDEVIERLKTTYRDFPLPQTTTPSTEIEQLRSIYGRTRSQFFTGLSANKQQALTASNQSLLHFGTRAFLDQSVPLYSFIMLSPDLDASDDGLLRLWEVTNLNSRARVVVLPFSNLAQPRSQYSNSLIAMSWAWFIAGTPTVVLSRWEADALSTTAFSSELHRNLRHRNNPSDNAETVRLSMLKLRQSKDRTPYDWSGFMVLGDP